MIGLDFGGKKDEISFIKFFLIDDKIVVKEIKRIKPSAMNEVTEENLELSK